MFTPSVAKKITILLSTQAEEDVKLLCIDLIQQEHKKLKYSTPEIEKVASLARIELLEKLMEYKSHLGTAIQNGR